MADGAPPAPVLAALRAGWSDEVVPEIAADPRVVGLAFVGSLGRGEADDWSDVNLMVVVADGEVEDFADPGRNRWWRAADRVVDARQNAPAEAASAGTLYVRSGLPLGVNWYVYPASASATVWPADVRVVHDRAGLLRSDEPFAVLNARPPRRAGTTKSPDEIRLARLAMVPIAGKDIARRVPAAAGMLRFLGGPEGFVDPGAQLDALRALVAEQATSEQPRLEAAVDAYLDLVAGTIG